MVQVGGEAELQSFKNVIRREIQGLLRIWLPLLDFIVLSAGEF